MDARNDWKQPRRAAHRDQQRRELNPFTELEKGHSDPGSTTNEQIDDRGLRMPGPVNGSRRAMTSDAGTRRSVKPNRRRSSITAVPTSTHKVRTCTVKTMRNM